jgi:hypothetical protein
MTDEFYDLPLAEDRIDQGDIIVGCPIFSLANYDLADLTRHDMAVALARVLVVTQTCDLENEKTRHAACVLLLDADSAIQDGLLKSADVKGPVRAGRVWGWYFLPRSDEYGLPEMLADMRRPQTIRLDLLRDLVANGARRGRVQVPYREHLNRHFAETYGRIGLPQAYPTD